VGLRRAKCSYMTSLCYHDDKGISFW